MSSSHTTRNSRTVAFAPRLAELLEKYRGQDLFRLEPDTIGIADPDLMDAVLSARPAQAAERPTFKPIRGRLVDRADAVTFMRAVTADVRAALKTPLEPAADLTGKWPQRAHDYVRDLVFGREDFRFRLLVDRRLELTPKLTWSAATSGAALIGRLGADRPLSNLAAQVFDADNFRDRQYSMYLYRRVAAPVCFTVASLVTGALWLASPLDPAVSNRNILLETLRLLPPSWNLLRNRGSEYAALDGRIGADDDILLLTLLSQRDPRLWEVPEEFRPERWDTLDPETHPGYLPFGHASERCWGRHMVLPLAERILDIARRDGLAVDPGQTTGRVELDGLLEIATMRVRAGQSG
ncbi:cytochrome P450 [Nocardia arthritidis]|uniref:Cytochrome P450 n=1 Tax=Nocardia arthritidis TaxID=228602 RepID=A0A6G9YA74_9NOCA|nr:cytochrome P450 [Nocardia arthritidis]QIS10165.1 cytochrome P450 [Nocardia arthritidis]